MFKKTIGVIGFVVLSFAANAGLISGSYTTDDGKAVALQNLEWMSLDYTAGLSRNDVEDGFTDRYGTTWAEGDWTYATLAQTESLFGSLWGGVYSGVSNDNHDGAAWFIENFGGLGYDRGFGNSRTDIKLNNRAWTNLDKTSFLFGSDGECNVNVNLSCGGTVKSADAYYADQTAQNASSLEIEVAYEANTFGYGSFVEQNGVVMGIHSDNTAYAKYYEVASRGHLLVRKVEVPEPSTFAIFSLGMLGLVSRKFKKNNL